jgi:hypothetical protein
LHNFLEGFYRRFGARVKRHEGRKGRVSTMSV